MIIQFETESPGYHWEGSTDYGYKVFVVAAPTMRGCWDKVREETLVPLTRIVLDERPEATL